MKTLGKVQGVDVSDDGSSAHINLKPHECASPANPRSRFSIQHGRWWLHLKCSGWNANKLQKKPGGNRRLSQDCGATRDMLPLTTLALQEVSDKSSRPVGAIWTRR